VVVDAARLVINGAGLRSRIFGFFKIYVVAPYLPSKVTNANAVLSGSAPERVVIVFVRDRRAQRFMSELETAIERNFSDPEIVSLRARLRQLADLLLPFGRIPKSTVIQFDWLPGAGTRVSVDGRLQSPQIAGEEFCRALLSIWIGTRPIQEDLKRRLLARPLAARN
jgi:hypothetical protein